MVDPHPSPTARPTWCLSLVIPAYNEADGIRQAVAEADEALAHLAENYEVLVVDDGSCDGTAQAVVEEAVARPHVRLLRHPQNRGYGAALRTGFETARYEYIAFTDADCQFHLEDLGLLLPQADLAPVAVGYRVDRKDTPFRCFVSRCYNFVARTLLGTRVRDCDCALKVFRREALARLLPETSGFFVNTEMLCRARQLGMPVAEVGVRHRPRVRGASKVTPGDVPRVLRSLLPFWWGRVLFAAPPREGAPNSGILTTVFVALLACLLFFARPGVALQEPHEVRYAEIARQSLAEGRWLVPEVNGEPCRNPPLPTWALMVSYRLFGIHDSAARRVPELLSLLVVLLGFAWSRSVLGERAGLAGAILLCLAGRYGLLDWGTVPCSWAAPCLLASLAAGHLAVRGPDFHRGWWVLSAGACGLGVLGLGPIVVFLTVPPICLFRLLDRWAVRWTLRSTLAYLLIAMLIPLPWVGLREWYQPGFLVPLLAPQSLGWILQPFDAIVFPWYPLSVLLGVLVPWSLLLPGCVRLLLRRSGTFARLRPGLVGLWILAGFWVLGFYVATGCKQPMYGSLMIPFLALILGWYMDQLLARPILFHTGALSIRLTQTILLVAAVGAVLGGVHALVEPYASWWLAGVALLALWGVSQARLRERPRLAWGLSLVVAFGVLVTANHLVFPRYARKFSLRGQVRPLASVTADVPHVFCYPCRWDSVSFYLGRNDVRAFGPDQSQQLTETLQSHGESLAFVQSGAPLQDFLDLLPSGMEFVPRGRQGKLAVGLVRHRHEAPPVLFALGQGETENRD